MYRTNVSIEWWTKIYTKDVMSLVQRVYGAGAPDENTFLDLLANDNVVGQVAIKGDLVVGFLVYELYYRAIRIHTIGVDPQWRRMGIGTQLVDKLKLKLNHVSRNQRTHILCDVPERNLILQQFLRSNGFTAIIQEKDPELDDKETFLMLYSNSIDKMTQDIKNREVRTCQNESWES